MDWPSPWRGSAITINTRKVTSWTRRRCTWPRKAREQRAVRGSTTREQPVLRSDLCEARAQGNRNADRCRRSAPAQARASLSRRCRVRRTGTHAGLLAEVSGMPGWLSCNRNRNRDLAVHRHLPAERAAVTLPGVAAIFCSAGLSSPRRPAGESELPHWLGGKRPAENFS